LKLANVLALLLCTLSIGVGAEDAKSPSKVMRNVLEKHDLSGVDNKEIVFGKAIFPASGSIGFHTHPGDEAGYVLKGSITLKTKGKPDRRLVAGESFFNARGAVHSVEAGVEGATVLSTWVVDNGVPMATPAP
jgi:quercetin dioxygenase-like cupin family protein